MRSPGAGVGVAPFGRLPDGAEVPLFTLRDAWGLEVGVIPLGGAIVALRVPDREGRPGDVVLGYDELDGYRENPAYLGTLVGRFANRIRGGRFSLDGREYRLALNDPPNHLHGGPGGFHRALWRAAPLEQGVGVSLSYTSPDGEEGYPGTLEVRVTYRLAGAGELAVEYEATTDRPTPVSLTQHSYFNLTGDPRRDVLGHELELSADRFVPVDERLVPTGEIAPVEGTPFDFRRPTPVGARIDGHDPQLARAGGYDHSFLVRGGGEGEGVRPAARVHEPTTGRVLEVLTTEPAVQLYTGNSLDGEIRGKGGVRYARRTGLCLETQQLPDSPNQPAFPSPILRPGERYRSRTLFRFGVV